MEGIELKDIIITFGGIIISILGYGLNYMIRRIAEIVPQNEIRDLIEDRQRIADIDRKNLDARLTRIESFLFRLLEAELKDDKDDGTPKSS